MNSRSDETKAEAATFDFSAFPADTLFLDRRSMPGGRSFPDQLNAAPVPAAHSRPRKERRRRVDPTTFEKQYNVDEMEFMNSIQNFKSQSGKMFPSHGDILKVALRLGYRKFIDDDLTLEVAAEDQATDATPVSATVSTSLS